MLKSVVDVAADLAAGRLKRVLPGWHGGEAPVVALYSSVRHLPLKTRLLFDALEGRVRAMLAERSGSSLAHGRRRPI